jgi:hypothetical protein
MQHYVINFVSDLQQVCGFIQAFQFPASIKTELLLKVTLNIINLTLTSLILLSIESNMLFIHPRNYEIICLNLLSQILVYIEMLLSQILVYIEMLITKDVLQYKFI